jgi:thiol-disulfide isomerase/thioredoxin
MIVPLRLCALLLLGVLAPAVSASAPSRPAAVYPDFWNLKLAAIDGDSVALKQFRGKYLLLNFWGEWCGTCVQEIPFLNKLEAKYGKDRLQILGLLKSADMQRARRLIHISGMTWPQVQLPEAVEARFAIRKFPTNLLVSPQGEIVMDGFYRHFQDFKRRMGDSTSVVRESEIKAKPGD